MPIIDRRSAAVVSMIVVVLALAVAIPPFIAATGEDSSKTFTQTEGEDLQLTGTLFADLTDVRDGQSFTEVASIHTTDTDFNAAETLDNVTVEGSGESADVRLSVEASTFADSFESEPADAGTPDNWVSSGLDTIEVTTSRASDGSQSMFVDDGDSNADRISPSEQPYGSPITDNISASIYVTSATTDFGLEVFEGSQSAEDRVILVAMRGSELQYWDGSSWNSVTSGVNQGEWIDITIHDINPAADTFAITWSSPSDSGTATGLATAESTIASGYDSMAFRVRDSSGYVDDSQIGESVSGPGTYVSSTHSVNGAETGFVNVTLSDADAVVTWDADADGDGTFETEVSQDTRSTTGNYTTDLSATSGQNFRVNVTFNATGSDPVAELHDEGILTTTTEGTDVNVTLVDTETGQTVDTGPINESETRQFTIGMETVTVTNDDVLSGNESLMTYEYPTYYGMDGGVETVVSNAPLIVIVLGFIIVVMSLYAGRGV